MAALAYQPKYLLDDFQLFFLFLEHFQLDCICSGFGSDTHKKEEGGNRA